MRAAWKFSVSIAALALRFYRVTPLQSGLARGLLQGVT
jgi:hypothetical protein